MDMNVHLVERFGRGPAFRQHDGANPQTKRPPMVLNQSIRKYVRTFDRRVDLSDWMRYRDIPSSEEIFDSGRQHHHEKVEVSENIVVGPYESKEDYLERHYALLREDAVAPLRDAVSELQDSPHLMEADSQNSACVYEKVRTHSKLPSIVKPLLMVNRSSLLASHSPVQESLLGLPFLFDE